MVHSRTIWRLALVLTGFVLTQLPAQTALAHFQELIPSTDIVPDEGDHKVSLSLLFTHPVEGGPVMDMGPPEQFLVRRSEEHTSELQSH